MSDLPPLDQQRILAIYAHPDDECYCSGGTLAYYNAMGATTMVISATKGQAGQINDTRMATRHTLGAMREKELILSCRRLEVDQVECWDYMDGALNQADRDEVVGDIVRAIRQFRPHIVLSFGPDGAYGHPDHVAISVLTTLGFKAAGNPQAYSSDGLESHQPDRLYYAHFPERRLLLLDQVVKWLTEQQDRFKGTLDFVHGLSLFAAESTMLNYSSDFIETRWYPPGFCIVEQGEAASDLFVILSGTVEIKKEEDDGSLTHLNALTVGEFFGEMGIANSELRSAHVIAKDSVTCLILSPGEPTNYAGRGEGAALVGAEDDESLLEDNGIATNMMDVQDYIPQKIASISAHRTQYPITPDMFPEDMLKELFGREYFVRVYPPVELETTL